tara:strand:+ start:1182 stop:1490 length:309 start_codon:yes stop_codon:yes gene_type:complete
MQTTIEQFISRNHKAGTVTKFELIGHKQFAFFTTEKVSVIIQGATKPITIELEPWQILFVDYYNGNNPLSIRNVSKDCLKKWRVKENGEFKRLDIDNGATSI